MEFKKIKTLPFDLNSLDIVETSNDNIAEDVELDEAKRYVRRYFMKPQNIPLSNKSEVLNALVDHANEDSIIYTLVNLGDVKDTTKLTSNDVIYYYEDGILYDKNHVRIMDYDLAIKKEEERRKINPDEVSDATFADVYADRITGEDTEVTESNEFSLDFSDLREDVKKDKKCCICGKEIEGYGNNPEPYCSAENDERCCDACNLKFVIPARLNTLK